MRYAAAPQVGHTVESRVGVSEKLVRVATTLWHPRNFAEDTLVTYKEATFLQYLWRTRVKLKNQEATDGFKTYQFYLLIMICLSVTSESRRPICNLPHLSLISPLTHIHYHMSITKSCNISCSLATSSFSFTLSKNKTVLRIRIRIREDPSLFCRIRIRNFCSWFGFRSGSGSGSSKLISTVGTC